MIILRSVLAKAGGITTSLIKWFRGNDHHVNVAVYNAHTHTTAKYNTMHVCVCVCVRVRVCVCACVCLASLQVSEPLHHTEMMDDSYRVPVSQSPPTCRGPRATTNHSAAGVSLSTPILFHEVTPPQTLAPTPGKDPQKFKKLEPSKVYKTSGKI